MNPVNSSYFPAVRFESAGAYAKAYFEELGRAASNIDPKSVNLASGLIEGCIQSNGIVITCGNGGSAALANHLHCDFSKGIRAGTRLLPRLVSLSATVETITAIANDIAYEEIYAFQLQGLARAGDVLITFSSSGDSENVVRAVEWADSNGIHSIALTGFDGGRSARLADINIHVSSYNYGVVEDLHQSIMHILAQQIRMRELPSEQIGRVKF